MNHITEYVFHEVANLFPLMDNEAFTELKADIGKNGLIDPITLHDGQIVDGRNRYLACRDLGVEPETRDWSGNGSLVEFVCSINLKRRHLTTSQRAMVAVVMLPFLEAEAKERQRVAGMEYGRGTEKLPVELREPIDKHDREASAKAATYAGVSASSVCHAKKVAQEAPEKMVEIKAGKTTVDAAYKALKAQSHQRPVAEPEPKYKPGDLGYFSDAKRFSGIAIAQLGNITINDPQRVAALMEVRDFVDQQLDI